MSRLIINEESTILNSEFASTTSSSIVALDGSVKLSVVAKITVTTPSAKAFATTDVGVTNNTITEPAHGFKVGLKGQFTTTTTLPGGLSLATDYFVIEVDANTYKVATTLSNATAGTAVDLTDQGVGTHTFTPTALAGAVIDYMGSNDGITYVPYSGNFSITSTSDFMFNVTDVATRYLKFRVTLTAGQVAAELKLVSWSE